MREHDLSQRFNPAREAAQRKPGSFSVPSRRGLISGIVSLIAAPALVRAASLMPISSVPGVSVESLEEGWRKVSGALHRLTWELYTEGKPHVINREMVGLVSALKVYPYGFSPPPSMLNPPTQGER
jgi:hypothetical protein